MSQNHSITLDVAVDMTSSYRSNKESILDSSYRNQNILPICETFEVAAINEILGQTNCDYLRIYYGMDEDLKVHAILVGADNNGDDILTTSNEVIMETGFRCPVNCPDASPLNTNTP